MSLIKSLVASLMTGYLGVHSDDLGVHSDEDGLQGCILQVEDGDIVPWRERGVHVYSLVSRIGLISYVQGHQLVIAESKSRTDAGDPELT